MFRQHVNERRELKEDCLLLSNDEIINIQKFKDIAVKIVSQFNDFNSVHPEKDETLIDFVSHTSNQREILCSEIWKLDRFIEYVIKIASEQKTMCSSMILDRSE